MNLNKSTTFTAKTFYGLENILAEELKSLEAGNIRVLNRAVQFEGDKYLLYKSNIFLRTAIRILIPVEEFTVQSYDELYNKAREINWERYFTPYHTFFIDSSVNSKKIDHSHFAALKLKDAIADFFRDKYRLRPSIDKINPDYRINLHISNNNCIISLDSSGESLHKRGYKTKNVKAPLNEVLAAALIKLSNWNHTISFLDPMCGSGTLPIEAAMIAYNIPPNQNRKEYGFTNWQDYDEVLHRKILDEIPEIPKGKITSIEGRDISEKAIEISKANAKEAGLDGKINFEQCAFESLEGHKLEKGIIIMNPPYDIKLKKENINEFYTAIGSTFKKNFTGFDTWIFSGNKQAIKHIGLQPKQKITLFNGPVECKLEHYPIYKGTLKK
ncbi:MAG: class I SAM-dependent RNA methyltransferase [Bacteroidales bacterium]